MPIPRGIQQKIDAITAELDEIWPRWREQPTIKRLPIPYQCRLKWLLHRHKLLAHTTDGVPAPRDWPVRIIALARGSTGETKVYAQIIDPAHDQGGKAYSEELLAGPPKIDSAVVLQQESASVLAARINVPLETVEDLLPHVPAGMDRGEWIMEQVRAAKRAAREKMRKAGGK